MNNPNHSDTVCELLNSKAVRYCTRPVELLMFDADVSGAKKDLHAAHVNVVRMVGNAGIPDHLRERATKVSEAMQLAMVELRDIEDAASEL